MPLVVVAIQTVVPACANQSPCRISDALALGDASIPSCQPHQSMSTPNSCTPRLVKPCHRFTSASTRRRAVMP